jgi:hypothetical protein
MKGADSGDWFEVIGAAMCSPNRASATGSPSAARFTSVRTAC